MKKAKALEAFPPQMIELIEHASERPIKLDFPTRKAAESFRFRLYELKGFLRRQLASDPKNIRIGVLTRAFERITIRNPQEESPGIWLMELIPQDQTEIAQMLTRALSRHLGGNEPHSRTPLSTIEAEQEALAAAQSTKPPEPERDLQNDTIASMFHIGKGGSAGGLPPK